MQVKYESALVRVGLGAWRVSQGQCEGPVAVGCGAAVACATVTDGGRVETYKRTPCSCSRTRAFNKTKQTWQVTHTGVAEARKNGPDPWSEDLSSSEYLC